MQPANSYSGTRRYHNFDYLITSEGSGSFYAMRVLGAKTVEEADKTYDEVVDYILTKNDFPSEDDKFYLPVVLICEKDADLLSVMDIRAKLASAEIAYYAGSENISDQN